MSDGEVKKDGERAAQAVKGVEASTRPLSREELQSFALSVADMPVEEIRERKAGNGEFARGAEQLARERLGSIELTETHEYTKDGERVEYYARKMRASEMVEAGLIAREALDRLKEKYGLEDAGFTIYSRRRDKSGKLGERAASANIYTLLHGWTGNRSLYEIKSENGLSPTENILDLDPDGIVITLDGNGFGETTFDEAFQSDELKAICTARDYAHQENYIVSEILGLGGCKENVIQVGHSMGGAAVFWKTAEYGYKGLALAPALLASEENRKFVRDTGTREEVEGTLETFGARERMIQASAKLIYAVLGTSMRVGEQLNKIAPPLERAVEWTTNAVFKRISAYLMGSVCADKEANGRIVGSLESVHTAELTPKKMGVTAYAIHNLRETDLSSLSPQQMGRLRNLVIAAGPKDALVPYDDLKDALVTLACFGLKAQTTDHVRPGTEEATAEAATAVCELLWATHQRLVETQKDKEEGAGHYAPVFSRRTPGRAVELARRGWH